MKFVGAGVTEKLYELAPDICGRLWRELDIVPLVCLNPEFVQYGALPLRSCHRSSMYVRPSVSPLERVRLPNLILSASLLRPATQPRRIPRLVLVHLSAPLRAVS